MNLKTTTKTNSKQTTRRGTESEKWTSHGEFSVGMRRGGIVGGKVQGIRSIIGRHKIDRERQVETHCFLAQPKGE